MKKRDYSLSIMIVLTVITQILTLYKSSQIARAFGTSNEMDAYHLANSICSFFYGLFAAGITTMLIPAYAKKNRNQANVFVTVLFSFLVLSTAILILFRTPIIRTLTNRNAAFVFTAAKLVIVISTMELFSAFSGVSTAYFHCIGSYNIQKVLNLLSQAAIVLFVVFAKNMDIFLYSYVLWAIALAVFLINWIIANKKGIGFQVDFKSARDPEVRKILYAFLPVLFSNGIYKLSIFIDSLIAANLETGMITILNYSQMIVTMINSVLIGNLLAYEYPHIVVDIHENKSQDLFWDKTIALHCIVCLVIVAFFAGGKQAIEFLFLSQRFDQRAVNILYIGTVIYVFGQQTNIVRDLIYRYFYAMQETKETAKNSVLVSAVNISVSLFLVFTIGFYGIIIGTVVASLVSLLMILLKFRRRFGLPESFKSILKKYFVNLLGAGISILGTILCQHVLPDTIPLLLDLFLNVSIASGLYLISEYLLNKKTVLQTVSMLIGKNII